MIAGCILAGGKNSRMNGQKKVFLTYDGEQAYERISAVMQPFCTAVFLSVESKTPYRETGMPLIEDIIAEIGPMGGLYSAFQVLTVEALFVGACDMPFIDTALAVRLVQTYQRTQQAVVTVGDGRVHPLFGIYPRTILPVLKTMIDDGDYRMMHLLDQIAYTTVEADVNTVTNVNTPKDYIDVSKRSGCILRKQPYVFAISGYKNSGKTTLITQLIPELTRLGYQVAVIKHDGHDFESDVPGTDSYRHQKAGAYGTAVFSSERFMVTKACKDMDAKRLMQMFPEADIILIEGLKNSDYPKYVCRYPDELPVTAETLAADIISRLNE